MRFFNGKRGISIANISKFQKNLYFSNRIIKVKKYLNKIVQLISSVNQPHLQHFQLHILVIQRAQSVQ